MQRIWMRAYMRVHFMGFRTGDAVYVKPTGLIHKAVGATYWLTNGKGYTVHVAADNFGANLRQLVKYEGEVKKQQALDDATRESMKASQFGPKRVHQVRRLLKRSEGNR